MCISYICNRSSSDFGNFFASYLDYKAGTLLIDLLRRTTIARQLGSHSTYHIYLIYNIQIFYIFFSHSPGYRKQISLYFIYQL